MCRIKMAEIEYYNLVLFKLGSNLKLEDTKFKIQLLEWKKKWKNKQRSITQATQMSSTSFVYVAFTKIK